MVFKFFKRDSKKLDFNIKKSFLKDPSIKEVDFKKTLAKEKSLIYSKHAKEKVSQIPSLMPSFLLLFKKVLQNKTALLELRSKTGNIITLRLESVLERSKNSGHTDNAFIFEIKEKESSKKYYVKHLTNPLSILRGFDGVSEMIALEAISKSGFNVIPAHFAYKNKGKSFIFTEYQSRLIDAEKAFKDGLITKRDVTNIRSRLSKIERNVNSSLEKHYGKKASNLLIKDIAPNFGKEFASLPVFIDFQNKKLYLYDPWLLTIK